MMTDAKGFSNRQIEQIVVDLVSDSPGIKGVELITELSSSLYKSREKSLADSFSVPGGEELIAIINDLVKIGKLVEVEYVLPSMHYRIKSLYFPENTDVRVVEKE